VSWALPRATTVVVIPCWSRLALASSRHPSCWFVSAASERRMTCRTWLSDSGERRVSYAARRAVKQKMPPPPGRIVRIRRLISSGSSTLLRGNTGAAIVSTLMTASWSRLVSSSAARHAASLAISILGLPPSIAPIDPLVSTAMASPVAGKCSLWVMSMVTGRVSSMGVR